MKRPQPDIGELILQEYLGSLKNVRKFKRLWGTTTVNGVEVLKQRQYYYPASARSANFEQLFKYLGMYDSVVSTSTKGITSAWIYLNRNKNTTLNESYIDYVTDNLNKLWWDDADGPRPATIKLTTSIIINHVKFSRDSEGFVVPNGVITPDMSTAQLKTAIAANYDTLWDSCSISHRGVGVINKGVIQDSAYGITRQIVDSDDLSPSDPWLSSLSRHALKSNSGIPCTIKDVKIGYTQENWDTPAQVSTYIVTLEIPEFAFTTTTGIVTDIANALSALNDKRAGLGKRSTVISSNPQYTQQKIKAMSANDVDEDPALITRPYVLWENSGIGFEDLWVNANGTWYLRADAFDNPAPYNFKLKDFNTYVIQSLDSDYRKKKASFWQKLGAVLVFVVAFYFAPFTGGASLTAGQALAANIIFAAFVVSITGAVLAATGNIGAATAFFSLSKALEPFVFIASIYLAVTSFLSSVSADKVAAATGKTAAEVTVVDKIVYAAEVSLDRFVESIIEGATDLFSGTISSQSIAFTDKLIQLYTLPEQIKLKKLNERNKDLQAEYEELAKELSQEQNILLGFLSTYSKPATAEWSIYAGTFDQPYERGGGPLHIGNVQRTTKQAIRKTSYDDPAFTDILII